MHENRETSELSARESGADRPEKAESRTTGMNGTEGSDRAVDWGMAPIGRTRLLSVPRCTRQYGQPEFIPGTAGAALAACHTPPQPEAPAQLGPTAAPF